MEDPRPEKKRVNFNEEQIKSIERPAWYLRQISKHPRPPKGQSQAQRAEARAAKVRESLYDRLVFSDSDDESDQDLMKPENMNNVILDEQAIQAHGLKKLPRYFRQLSKSLKPLTQGSLVEGVTVEADGTETKTCELKSKVKDTDPEPASEHDPGGSSDEEMDKGVPHPHRDEYFCKEPRGKGVTICIMDSGFDLDEKDHAGVRGNFITSRILTSFLSHDLVQLPSIYTEQIPNVEYC
jgi:hypothetical protein